MNIARKTLFYIMLLTLVSCQSPAFVDFFPVSGQVLFYDDFSDIEKSWQVPISEGGSFARFYGGYLISISKPFFQSWTLAGLVQKDVRVEVDAMRLAGPLINLFGIVCRASTEGKFYFFILSSDGYYAIGKSTGNGTSLLGQEVMAFSSAIKQGNEINRIRFDCIDSLLTGYVNEQMIALTKDDSFQIGDVGLMAGSFDAAGVEIIFDDFIIYTP